MDYVIEEREPRGKSTERFFVIEIDDDGEERVLAGFKTYLAACDARNFEEEMDGEGFGYHRVKERNL